MCSECFDTAIWASSASVGQLPSRRCAGALASVLGPMADNGSPCTTPARPLGAGVSGAQGDDHLTGRRDVIQPLGPVLTDPDHVAATASPLSLGPMARLWLIIPYQNLQPVPPLRAKHHRHAGMRIELQLGLHFQRQSLVTAAKVHRSRRDQDRQALPGDDHGVPRSARTTAAARAAGTSPGTRSTRSWPNSIVMTPPVRSASADGPGLSGSTDTGTKAGSLYSGISAMASAGRTRKPSRA